MRGFPQTKAAQMRDGVLSGIGSVLRMEYELNEIPPAFHELLAKLDEREDTLARASAQRRER
jgi:hypothetical protein